MIYDRLEAMGYLITKPGVGRFLRLQKDKIEIPLVANKSFTEKIKEMGYSLESQLIECCEVDVKFKAFENKDPKDAVIKFQDFVSSMENPQPFIPVIL